MALFINTYWRLPLTNTLVHPQWVFAVNLKDLSCLWHRKDDPTRILVSFRRDDRWQRQTEDAGRGHRYRCHQPDPLCPQPFPSCYCLNVCSPPVAVHTLLWQMPWPKATPRRKGLFDLQSQVTVHHFGGSQVRDLHNCHITWAIKSREKRMHPCRLSTVLIQLSPGLRSSVPPVHGMVFPNGLGPSTPVN